MNKHKGQITISRPQSSRSGDYISITIRDSENSAVVLELDMAVEAFAYAITGLAMQDCNFEVWADMLSKERQHKTVVLYFDTYPHPSEIIEAIKPYEVDGWKHLLNNGRSSFDKATNKYVINVTYARYVEVQP